MTYGIVVFWHLAGHLRKRNAGLSPDELPRLQLVSFFNRADVSTWIQVLRLCQLKELPSLTYPQLTWLGYAL